VPGFCEHGNEPSGFHKVLGISSAAEELLSSKEALSFLEIAGDLVTKFVPILNKTPSHEGAGHGSRAV
jgi:hypothetical protein